MKDIVIRVSPEVYAELEALAQDKGVSIEQLLANGLDLEVTLADIKKHGGRLLVEKEGHVQELVPA